jgi:pimeloyl-ACP methyl ester carboxylesterase
MHQAHCLLIVLLEFTVMNEPLILVPGLNCTAALYGSQMDVFGQGRTIIIPDHRSDDTLEAIAERFLTDAPRRFALCGLSMGVYIAFAIMARAPERVTRVALLDSRCAPDSEVDAQNRHRLIGLAQSGRFDDVHHILWQRLVHPGRLGDRPLEAIIRSMMAATGANAFIRQQKAMLNRPDYSHLLAKIAVPTLVLSGAQDLITPPHYAQDMATKIKNSRLMIVPDCGHLSTLEAPEVVNAELSRWLEE